VANRRWGFSNLGCVGALAALGFGQFLFDVVTSAWRRGDYSPAIKVGSVVTAVVVAVCVTWWVREYGIAIWNRRRRTRQRERGQAG